MTDYSSIPESLRARKTWLLHKCEPDSKKPGKIHRVPHGADGKRTNTNPTKFLTFEHASGVLARFDGLTLALTGDGLCCIDLDGCRNASTGELTPLASEIVALFPDTYIEISGSGTGLHIFFRANLPKNSHPDKSWVEIYRDSKPIAMTGNALDFWRTEVKEHQEAADAIFKRCEMEKEFSPVKKAESVSAKLTGDDSSDDFHLIGALHRKMKSASADELEAAFRKEHRDRYEQRNREKKGHRPNYIRYSIDRFLAKQKPGIAAAEPVELAAMLDMSTACLDGRLGEICEKYMVAIGLPRSYSYLALLTYATLFAKSNSPSVRCNLYTCLAGPIGFGKSSTEARARHLLGIPDKSNNVFDGKAGSGEGLAERIGDRGGAPVVCAPDELSHLLSKSKIENASFFTILTTAFYQSRQELVVAKRKQVTMDASMSIIGGVVDDRFSEVFGASSSDGLYDRNLFGMWPSGLEPYAWRPPEFDQVGARIEESMFVPVTVDPTVWEALKDWRRKLGVSRIPELCLRAAVIAASASGRTLLTAKDLGPALEFARYQLEARARLKPNQGETLDAEMESLITGWADAHASVGVPVLRRKLYRDIHANRLGSRLFDTTLFAMERNELLVQTPQDQRPRTITFLTKIGDSAGATIGDRGVNL